MDKAVANEIGKIAALVAQLRGRWEVEVYRGSVTVFDWRHGLPSTIFAKVNYIKTRKERRIPQLRRLADLLRAELSARK